MTYHSEVETLLTSVNELRRRFEEIVISEHRGSDIDAVADIYGTGWNRAVIKLQLALGYVATDVPEVRQALYQRGLQQIRNTEGFGADSPTEPNHKPRIAPKVQQALDYIKLHGPVKGILVARHIKVSYPRFRSVYRRRLGDLGVRNDGKGYYVDETAD